MKKALLLNITVLCIVILLAGVAGYSLGVAHGIEDGFDQQIFSRLIGPCG